MQNVGKFKRLQSKMFSKNSVIWDYLKLCELLNPGGNVQPIHTHISLG